MTTKKISPHRRKSIAGTNQNVPSIVPRGRRRAHSIVPGATLSPQAKARRSLAPRKSILKGSVNLINVDPSSQQPNGSSQPPVNDDTNATGSMEMTQDYAAPIHDNTTRKSLGGRRVSWLGASHVRMYDPKRKASFLPSPPDESPDGPSVQSNENDYPGQNSRRRRSSMRYSMAGSEDMDMTTIMQPGGFQPKGSAILDEEFEFDEEEEDYGDDDMEVTEAIRGHLSRKRSLSMGGRQPLAQVGSTSAEQSFEGDNTRSDIGNESAQSIQSDATSEQSSYMIEFTVPLGQSLRPAEKDDVWLALKQMTHSGDQPSEPESSFEEEGSLHGNDEMPLGDAVERLLRARDSLPLSGPQEVEYADEPQDDTFTDTEDSFNDNEIDGNKTLNLSHVLGRPSIGLNSRMSMGYESNMDESEVYGNMIAHSQSTPRHSLAPPSQQTEEASTTDQPPQQPRKSSVFQPPPADAIPKSSATPVGQSRKSTGAFSFTPRAPSPSKTTPNSQSKPKPKPTFSAAFAPPVARPSPKKPPPSASTSTVTPAKRPRPPTQEDDAENMDVDQPSPAKRQALASKWLDVAEAPKAKSPSLSPVADRSAPAPQPLSPTKKAPFQAASDAETPAAASHPLPSALRRPSGYFARRKSMAVSFNIPTESESPPAATSVAGPSTTKKKPGIGMGRASMGAAPSHPWTRPDKSTPAAPALLEPISPSKSKGKGVEADSCIRETARQASASPSPTRGSPAPLRQLSAEPVPEPRRPSPEPHRPTRLEQVLEEPEDDLSANMEVDTDATQQWREGVEQTAYEEEVPSISVVQFFSMTGIKFMDELTAPRRSIHPSQQPLRQPRNPADIALAEYVTAMAIDVPQLELYSRVSMDLEAWIAKSRLVFAQAEEEAAKVTPELFVEYARADEEGQAELLHQLNLIRTHTRYLARSDWYDWKLQWVEGLRVTADEAFASLENDARMLEEPKKSAAEIIPELEKEYENLMRELEQEQAEVAEIESGDQDYLNDLKATIADQNIEIEALKAELAEGTDQVRWLQERTNELEAQTRETKNTITTAERVLRLKQTSTRSEVFRLKDELEALEDLHMCRITKVSADLFEYVYSSLFQVSIPCKNFKPIVAKVSISRHGKQNTRYKDNFPRLSSFLLTAATQLINHGDDFTVREIVHRLSDYWSSCAELRSQLTLLSIKYPVEIAVPPPSRDTPLPSFKAKAMVMFPSAMAKAYISFVFSFNTFSRWPLSIDSLDCEVDVAYGSVDRSTIVQAVVTRLSQATPSESYACLLDACIEAQDVYH